MRTVEEHQRIVAELISARPGILAELRDAHGRVLSEDVSATVSLPVFDNSAMDGYAVRAAEVAGANPDAPVELPVAEDIPAGRVDVPALEPGTAHRIMTGAPVPLRSDGGRAGGSHRRWDGGRQHQRASWRGQLHPSCRRGRRGGQHRAAGRTGGHTGGDRPVRRAGIASAAGHSAAAGASRLHRLGAGVARCGIAARTYLRIQLGHAGSRCP